MATAQVDAEDAALAAVFGLSAGTSLGIADVSLFGYNLSDSAFALSGTDITYAVLVSVIVLGIVYATNEPDIEKIRREGGDYYYFAVLGTAALVLGIAFVPQLSDWVTGNDFLAVAALAVESAGYIALSYMG